MKRIKEIISHNSGLKMLSLFLAIILWFYIIGELSRLALEEEIGIRGGIHFKIVAKTLPVVVNIEGEVEKGFYINRDKITVTPKVCSVVGPKRVLDTISNIKTIPIDVSDFKETVTVHASLESPTRGVKVIDKFATVVIPVERVLNSQ